MFSLRRVFGPPAWGLALLVAVSSPAVAQVGLGNPALEFPGLSQAALDNMHAAAAKLFDGRVAGAVETWATPDGGTSGTVQLLRSFTAYNMPCRTIDYVIELPGTLSTANPNHYVLNWCRIPAGAWKIVQIPTPN
jgi:hypothetical protein